MENVFGISSGRFRFFFITDVSICDSFDNVDIEIKTV